MWHGSLEGDAFRHAWLAEAAAASGRVGFESGTTSFDAARQQRIDALADSLEEHVDLDRVLELIEHGPPAGLPTVPGGLA
jgi:adenosylcobyric acid synthase